MKGIFPSYPDTPSPGAQCAYRWLLNFSPGKELSFAFENKNRSLSWKNALEIQMKSKGVKSLTEPRQLLISNQFSEKTLDHI